MMAHVGRRTSLEAFEADCIGAVLLDPTLTVIDVTAGVVALSGHDADILLGRSALGVVHPDDMERARDALFESMATLGESAEGMYRLRFGDDTYHDFSVAATCLGPDHDNATAFQFRQVPLRLRAEEFARDSVDTLRLLAESHELDTCLERVHRLAERHILGSRTVITTLTTDGASRSHQRLSDELFASDVVIGDLPVHVQGALDDHMRGPWRSFNRMANFESLRVGSRVTSVLCDDNHELLGFVESYRTQDDPPDDHEWMVHGLVRQVLTSVLRRVRLDVQLREAADSDYLTGLANRRRLFHDMEQHSELENSTLLMVDLDRFSWINNTLGHHVGDEALVAVADGLRAACPVGSTISRFGGDEFVIWIPAGLADPRSIAETIRGYEIRPASSQDRRARVHCSIGAVTIAAGESPTNAIKRADEAMYVAKRRGGDAVQVA